MLLFETLLKRSMCKGLDLRGDIQLDLPTAQVSSAASTGEKRMAEESASGVWDLESAPAADTCSVWRMVLMFWLDLRCKLATRKPCRTVSQTKSPVNYQPSALCLLLEAPVIMAPEVQQAPVSK